MKILAVNTWYLEMKWTGIYKIINFELINITVNMQL